MMCVALGSGLATSRNTSRLTPSNDVASFDQVVTQWMSPSYFDCGSACASSHDQVLLVSTSPSRVRNQRSVRSRGVTSAVRTGQSWPTSY